jgi:hypothetical protein
MEPLGPRAYSRSLLRTYLGVLRELALFDPIRARASPALGALMDQPVRAPAWLDPPPFDELIAAVGRQAGREGCRDFGYRVMKAGGYVSVLEPILHFSLKVLGGNAGTLLAKAHLMSAVVTRGIEMKWVPSGFRAGAMRMRCDDAMQDFAWAGWEGSFLFGCELAGAQAQITPARCAPDGRSCEIDVQWTAP